RGPIPAAARAAADVLKAELLERTDGRASVRAIVDRLLTVKLTPDERTRCQIILARIDRESGDTSAGIKRLQKIVSGATEKRTEDPRLEAWALVMLTLYVAESSGPDATAPLVAKLRELLTRIGSGQLWAALHMCLGSIDARRGLIRNAR